MINSDIKNQIFEIFKTRFKSAGVPTPSKIFIFYEQNKKIKVGYDDVEGDECGFADNMIMKNFLLSQIKSQLSKVTKEKVTITHALSTIDLSNETIYLDCFYNTTSLNQQTFNYSL